MACKLVVKRFTAGKSFIGDCIGLYPYDKYLGDSVEPVGGAFSLIEITDADEDDPELLELCEDWVFLDEHGGIADHPLYDKAGYLHPVSTGDPYFAELAASGRIQVRKADVMAYARSRESGS